MGQQQWSPRGSRILFDRGFESSVRSALYSVEPDGDGLDRLVKAPMPLSLSSGAWSPDGRAIVYAQSRLGPAIVRVFRRNAVTTLASGRSPTWSRRGLIAYETRRPGTTVDQVCLARFRTDAEPVCIGFDDAWVDGPTWLPSGRRLLVAHTPQAGGTDEIWTIRPDGTVLARAPSTAGFPIPSPNGRRLTYTRTRFRDGLGYEDLFARQLDGTGTRLLVRGGQAQHPDWQPRR